MIFDLLGLTLPFLGLFVMISLVTFAIPTHAEWLIGRLGLLITLFLVLVTIFSSSIETLPSAETPTLLNIWMVCCILFILGVFLQSTIIIFILYKYHIAAHIVAGHYLPRFSMGYSGPC